jgi:Cdc6-like AAA superfamily ATPase
MLMRNIAEKDRQCIQDLHSTDPRDDKRRIEETKGGLLKDSYRWILYNPDFRQWQNNQRSKLLWIKGDPGKGKTMLLCGIINELETSIAKKDLLSYFFCQATDSRINNATAVLRGLLYLLVDQQPSLVSHIRKKYDSAGKAFFEDTNAWVALSEIFTNILEDPSLNSTYLIVDALDECREDLPKLLRFIVQKSSISRRVKWIVSSRNSLNIEEHLELFGHKVRLCLELNTESISTAVKIFIQHKVLQLAHKKKLDRNSQNAVEHHLSSNANDTFLWVALVCQNLETMLRLDVLAKLYDFPPGLEPLYKQMMHQISNSNNAGFCKRILASIAIVYQTITLQELATVTELREDMVANLETLRDVVSLCGSFLTVQEGTIYFVHQSAKDFLLANALDMVFPSGREEVHYTIFSRSLQIMSKTLQRDMYSLEALGHPAERVHQLHQDPLAASRYSCIYWADHLCDLNLASVARYDNVLLDGGIIDVFLREKFLYWLEALSLCKGVPNGVASVAKLLSLFQACSPHNTIATILC